MSAYMHARLRVHARIPVHEEYAHACVRTLEKQAYPKDEF
jgi:hypothetical protein